METLISTKVKRAAERSLTGVNSRTNVSRKTKPNRRPVYGVNGHLLLTS